MSDQEATVLKKNRQGHNLKGRQKGVKNKTTLFKEAMRDGFEDRLSVDGLKVFDAVVQKAIGPASKDKNGDPILDENGKQMYLDGDVTAQKMIMDRIVPVVDTEKVDKGKFNISINVAGVNPSVEVIDAKPIDGEFEEVDND